MAREAGPEGSAGVVPEAYRPPESAAGVLGDLAARHLRALSLDLDPRDPPLPWGATAVLLLAHTLAILALVRLAHQPAWLALLPVLLLLPLLLSLRLRRLNLVCESLAPLVVAYAILVLRLGIAFVARAQAGGQGSFEVPQPWGRLLDFGVGLGLSTAWVLLAQAGLLARAYGTRPRWQTLFGYAALAFALVWAARTYIVIVAAGVTASDPYAYVQMALDLARSGTVRHTFSLAPEVARWGLPVWPTVPVGYNPPNLTTGMSATVWPPGQAALLAAAYLLSGERGMMLTTPLLGLASLVATWFLAREVLRSWSAGQARFAAGLAVLVLATSYIQIRNLAVPMADVPAQLFTLLTVYFALRARRTRPLLLAAVSGLCLAAAFAVRYTQVLVAPAVLLAWLPLSSAADALRSSSPRAGAWRRFGLQLACFGAAALLLALPVLWYHQLAFGSPFSVGSSELGSFGLQYVPHALAAVSRELLAGNEFFYLAPFVLWGFVDLWRGASRRSQVVLVAWLLAIAGFHLFYAALRARDLLSVFPVLALWAGAGASGLVGALGMQRDGGGRSGQPVEGAASLERGSGAAQSSWRPVLLILVALLIVGSLWARTRVTLQLATGRVYFNTFGYLRPEQRAAFDALARIAPPGAIVGTSLNAGPVVLYAGRDAVRPGYWSRSEWLAFLDRALAAGHAVYLLPDGDELQEALSAAQSRYRLVPVATLAVPYFSPNGGSDNRDLPLYEITH